MNNKTRFEVCNIAGAGTGSGDFSTQPIDGQGSVDITLAMRRHPGAPFIYMRVYLEIYNPIDDTWQTVYEIGFAPTAANYYDTFTFENCIGVFRVRANMGSNSNATCHFKVWGWFNYKD